MGGDRGKRGSVQGIRIYTGFESEGITIKTGIVIPKTAMRESGLEEKTES
jgi:hypothetical protein